MYKKEVREKEREEEAEEKKKKNRSKIKIEFSASWLRKFNLVVVYRFKTSVDQLNKS